MVLEVDPVSRKGKKVNVIIVSIVEHAYNPCNWGRWKKKYQEFKASLG